MPTVFEQLAEYTPQDRPAAVVHAMRQLARRAGHDFVTIAQLAQEAHQHGYWSKVMRQNGEPYLTEEEFFAEVLQVQSWRSALKRIAIGQGIAKLPEEIRGQVAERLAEVGVAKATILAPLLETKPEAITEWVERAEAMDAEGLQAAVSDALSAKPRGTAGGVAERDRVLGFLTSVMPDLDSRALLEEFLRLGHAAGAGETTVAILLSAMRECVVQWQPAPVR